MLGARSVGETRQLERIAAGLSKKTYVVPWLAEPPVGIDALSRLTVFSASPATSA
jgi:arsenite-transporting ATPase